MAASVLVDAGFIVALLRRRSLRVAFDLAEQIEPVLKLMQKYAGVPMSLADACLVRTTTKASATLIVSPSVNHSGTRSSDTLSGRSSSARLTRSPCSRVGVRAEAGA